MSESVTLHFADTETTGIIDKYPDAEITEIAIVTWRDGDAKQILHERVRPKKPMPEKSKAFNKSFDAAAYASLESWGVDASACMHDLLKGALVSGSNPDFDKRMIAAECFRTGAGRPDWHHRSVNTASLGMMLWIMGETDGSGLGHLTKYFGIAHDAHTALGDCYAAIAVWEKFFDRFIWDPRRMKEALEEIEARTAGKGRGAFNLDEARALALRGLVGGES